MKQPCKVHPIVNVTDPEKPVCMVCDNVVPEAAESFLSVKEYEF